MAFSSYDILVFSTIRVYCDGLARLLTDRPRVGRVRAVSSWLEAHDGIQHARPDAVLLDASGGHLLSHVGALRQVCAALIVAIGVSSEAAILACARAGVDGVCEEHATGDDVIAAISRASHGEIEMSARSAAALFRRAGRAADVTPTALVATLTEREADVLALMQRGLSNKEIAIRLGVRTPTVKNHVHNLMSKLRIRRRHEAIVAGAGHGYGLDAPRAESPSRPLDLGHSPPDVVRQPQLT